MDPQSAQASIDAIDTSPSLSVRPSLPELLAGMASVIGVLAGSAAVIIATPPRAVGIAVAAALLVVNVAWWTRRRPGQARRGLLDTVAQLVSLGTTAVPASLLIWPADQHVTTGALVASTMAAAGLAVFVALRWRP